MANYGIRVAKEGFNVLEADDTQLAFSSSFPISQGRVKLTTDLTVGASSRLTVTVINSSFDYLPYVNFGMYSTGNGYWHSIHTTYNEQNTQGCTARNLSGFGEFSVVLANTDASSHDIEGVFYAMDDGVDS